MKKKVHHNVNAVIGYPLLHTRSPHLHALAYRSAGITAATLAFPHPDIRALVSAIRTGSIGLTAVTMPHKESIMPLLDRIDPAAKSIGAVNTVVNRKGVLSGYNTDLDGIAYALKGLSLARKKVLIVGAGGAARAVAHVVRKQGGEIIYLNRTAAKARKLMKEFGGRIAKEKELVAGDIDLIVNATPVGMHPKTAGMPLSERLIAKHQAVFDLVYNPLETRLLKTAKRKGAKAISGLDMFVVQGLRQVELMSGRKIITPESVRSAARSLKKKI